MFTSALCCPPEPPARKKAARLPECSPLPLAVPLAGAPYHIPSAAGVQQHTYAGHRAADFAASTLRHWAGGSHSSM